VFAAHAGSGSGEPVTSFPFAVALAAASAPVGHGEPAAGRKPYDGGRQQRHGVHARVVADPAGRLKWISAVPGSTHDLTAALHGIVDALTEQA
jgi:hypothetical protein